MVGSVFMFIPVGKSQLWPVCLNFLEKPGDLGQIEAPNLVMESSKFH